MSEKLTYMAFLCCFTFFIGVSFGMIAITTNKGASVKLQTFTVIMFLLLIAYALFILQDLKQVAVPLVIGVLTLSVLQFGGDRLREIFKKIF